MGREFELKYRATPEQLEKIRGEYGEFETIRMETTYYDSPDRTLSRLHWTFRRRMENDRSICTLKSDLPDGSRGEWEMECADILSAVPALLAMGAPEQLAEYTKNGVMSTCGARFTRLAKRIPCPGGEIELALDQGVLLGGGSELPFAEAEVELKSGPDSVAELFAVALAARYGLTAEKKSKIKRALALAENG